jgi:hypothetical protein
MPEAGTVPHRPFLQWRRGLYGKVAAAITVVCIILYAAQRPAGPPNGGTTLGYVFGTLAASLVLWLAWFGIRRRRYGGTENLEAVLSAHVYFGLGVVVLAALHAGFRFHWNVHTLAFILLVLVAASGAFGTYSFMRFPGLMTRNRNGATLTTMTAELAATDMKCRQLALALPDDILSLVEAAVTPVPIGNGFAALLSGSRHQRAAERTLAVIARIQALPAEGQVTSPASVLPLVQALAQRLVLMQRLRRDQRYRAMMLQWRAVHVPLTVGLVVALCIHVIVVFFDW